MRTLKAISLCVLVIASVIIMPSCNSSKRTQGASIGATVGAATGALLGKKNRAVAMVLGASIGGIAGGLVGDDMDKQAEEIRKDLRGAKIERVAEGIVVTFDSGLLFDFDSDALKSETKTNLDELAKTLKKYDKTDVVIFGHTDNIGEKVYNLQLSDRRANAVERYLIDQSVTAKRLRPEGMGENDPVAANETETGRQKPSGRTHHHRE
ncbi:MAG: OmpA family protein [Saprospiraceae bacterium]|nr:OmpA family protein [Saprospiraceae bacterium]